jgi:hypothetical protein
MNPNQYNSNPLEPGDVDMIISTELHNPYKSKALQIISGEYEDLNGKFIQPGEVFPFTIVVPAGYREFINPTYFKNTPYIYVGLRDKDAAEPMIHSPKM